MNGWDRMENRIERGPMSAFLWIGSIIFVMCCVGSCVSFVVNPVKQASRIVSKTIDADNVIYNYEWFKIRHEGIIALDKKILTAKKDVIVFEESLGPRSEWDREDKIEYARLSSISTGLIMQRDDLVGEYNAKSRMVNRNIFKTGDTKLPERIK